MTYAPIAMEYAKDFQQCLSEATKINDQPMVEFLITTFPQYNWRKALRLAQL